MFYYVYIVQCEDGSLYTGYTTDIESRMKRHVKGQGARYTRMNKPTKLVHIERYHTRSEAMKRERQIKNLSHHQKLDLANSAHVQFPK